MKKSIKYILITLISVILIFFLLAFYKITSRNLMIREKMEIVEKDELEYGDKYETFSSEVYKENPQRIIFKKENTTNQFYVFSKDDEEYDRILKVTEDRMYYSANQDFNLWSFTPYVLSDVSDSNENFIIFDYNDEIDNKDYMYETDFNRNIFFRFSNNTRLYRLMDYLSYIYKPVNVEELKLIIGKEDFIPKEQIISGYKYMNPSLLMD